VDDDGRRGDPAVVVPQAAAAEDGTELSGDADRVIAAAVTLGCFGPDPFFWRRVGRAADDPGDRTALSMIAWRGEPGGGPLMTENNARGAGGGSAGCARHCGADGLLTDFSRQATKVAVSQAPGGAGNRSVGSMGLFRRSGRHSSDGAFAGDVLVFLETGIH
jgi:hypothetical protein